MQLLIGLPYQIEAKTEKHINTVSRCGIICLKRRIEEYNRITTNRCKILSQFYDRCNNDDQKVLINCSQSNNWRVMIENKVKVSIFGHEKRLCNNIV